MGEKKEIERDRERERERENEMLGLDWSATIDKRWVTEM